MKTSELIAELQKAVDQVGDLDILVRSPEDGWDADGITVWPDPPSEAEKEEGISGTIDINAFETGSRLNREYVILNTEHRRWPECGLLFWGSRTLDDSKRSFGGYTTNFDQCEKYTREELEAWRTNPIDYPFFDEIHPKTIKELEMFEDVLCTIEDLKTLGFRPWTIIARL